MSKLHHSDSIFTLAMPPPHTDISMMQRAIELARCGEGYVEPNPMVGCVIAREGQIAGEGFHGRFGGPHAEVEALAQAGEAAAGATAYVSLEPCCHHGKTPPCSEALIRAGVRRVVIATRDPFPQVAAGGLGQLREAGIKVDECVCQDEARQLNAPYFKLVECGRPWVIAKWAMTLDGRMATRTGSSQWISGEASRAIVHRLRGRVDAVMVGRGTAVADDPLLTARPPGARVATRIVLDSTASLSPDSQLVRTTGEAPVLVAAGPDAPRDNMERLEKAGCEVFICRVNPPAARLGFLLEELGRRRMTNVLVEGGATLLGNLFDAAAVDEVHVFIAPKIIGGATAPAPVAGGGIAEMADALRLHHPTVERIGEDVYVQGRVSEPRRR